MERIALMGVEIDCITAQEALERALERRGGPCTVVTPNAVILERCRRDAGLATMLSGATLSLADGRGVLMAARRKGVRLPERVAGIDFGERLLARAAEEGLRVFLIGGADGVAARAGERLCRRYPSLRVCGCYWGYGGDGMEESERVMDCIRRSRPDVLFVCMGFPTQERWIFSHLHELEDVRVIAGLGGSFDVWAGDIRRAPRGIQRMGMEWAWRMLRQPRRMRELPTLLRFATHRRSTY